MTISYNLDISTASIFAFLKLLFRWKASIWKIVLKELLIWTICYLLVSFLYKSGWLMSKQVESVFERTAAYFMKYLNRNSLTFILGFFVSSVATRWNVLFQNMGFVERFAFPSNSSGYNRSGLLVWTCTHRILNHPATRAHFEDFYQLVTDLTNRSQCLVFPYCQQLMLIMAKRAFSLALFVSCCIRGEDEQSRLYRRTIVRHACLAQCLVLRDISVRVRKRFPTMESLVEAGFLTKKEMEKFDTYKLPYDKYWVPISWSVTHVMNARRAGRVDNDMETNKLVDELKAFRSCLQILTNHDWVPLPLVYPQMITISVYFYFTVCLFARQHFLPHAKNSLGLDVCLQIFTFDIVLPVMTMVEFLFYVGWMKVAMSLLNPFGEDDDDLECNFFIDKNLATGLCIVDTCRDVVPDPQPTADCEIP